jgi:hypothetical protein
MLIIMIALVSFIMKLHGNRLLSLSIVRLKKYTLYDRESKHGSVQAGLESTVSSRESARCEIRAQLVQSGQPVPGTHCPQLHRGHERPELRAGLC